MLANAKELRDCKGRLEFPVTVAGYEYSLEGDASAMYGLHRSWLRRHVGVRTYFSEKEVSTAD